MRWIGLIVLAVMVYALWEAFKDHERRIINLEQQPRTPAPATTLPIG